MKFLDWVDSRTSYRSLAHHALDEPVLGGARWAYVFGSCLAVLFFFQAITGILLALFYSASTQEAWGSVWYMTHKVGFGWFVRGLHHWGSSAMVIVMIAHLLQVFTWGAYRAPREFAWWTGLFLLFVVLGFSLTGYLLPWDQKGYWASRVVTSIVGTFPLVGPFLKRTMMGGNDFGNLTLTRFFGFHVFFLPATLSVIFVAHMALFRKNGVTPWWSRKKEELEKTMEPFWPKQVLYDLIFAGVVISTVVFLTLREHGAPLEAPADPSSNYLARPEWYFLWLFEMLKVLPGSIEGIGLLGFSIFGVLFLAALPLVDRSPTPSIPHRWPHFALAAVLLTVIGTLTGRAMWRDSHDPAILKQLASDRADAERAYVLAEKGIPPGGADELYLNDPVEHGRRIFLAQCTACHARGGVGGTTAPALDNYLSHAWVVGVIADPTKTAYFGGTKVTGMEKTDATPAEIDVLADYVLSMGGHGVAPEKGGDVFEDKGCQSCHARAGDDPLTGPSLGGYGSKQWLTEMIIHPAAPSNYGDQNQMPSFEKKLTPEELDDLLAFLLPPLPPVAERK